MARRSPDGESRLVFVPADGIADTATPTATELNAVTVIDITPFAIEWDFPESGQTVDTADMSSSFNKQDIGTYGGDSGSVTIFRESVDADDDAFDALPRGTRGYFVERMFGGADEAFAAADKVSIFPGAVQARPAASSRQRNASLRTTVQWAMTAEPTHKVAVTSGV